MKFKFLVALLALNFISCDNYLDINEDPNNPNISQVHPGLMLPGAMTNAYRVQSRPMNQLGNIWMQNWGADVNNVTQANADEYRLQLSNDFYSGIWDGLYTSMANFALITKYNSVNYDNHKAVAMIMKAYYMQYIVDLYGDAPYSQAFQLADDTTPAYDDDKQIYRTLLSEIDTAVQMFYDADANDIELSNTDVMFQGNVNKWIRFANTLKLRLLLRQSSLTDGETVAYLNTQFAALDGAIFNIEDAAINPGYTNATAIQMNPFYSLFRQTNGTTPTQFSTFVRATAFVGDFLNGTSTETTGLVDPRGGRLYTLKGGIVSGAVQGALVGPEEMSDIGLGLLPANVGSDIVGAKKAGVVMSLAETNFMIAEAIVKGYLPSLAGQEENYFNEGVIASFIYLNVGTTPALSATQAGNYLANASAYPGIGWNGDFLKAIMTQKWIATNGINAIESHIDAVRTGFPVIPLATNALYANRPFRLLYPTSELVANSANVPSVSLSQIFTQGPFWKN